MEQRIVLPDLSLDIDSVVRRLLTAIAAVAVALYLLYQWLLPKPIPGIAYNLEATQSLLGDAPSMVKEVRVTGEFRVWCAKQMTKLNSPICQIFIRPFSKPWILLADFRESKDILMRRKEFDKSSFLSDGMACMGAFHGIYKTGDKFKVNRQLIQDLMTSSFLNNQVGPAIYRKGAELVRLTEMKMDLANGRPFSAKKDFEYASLDVMLEFAFGRNWTDTSLGQQTELIGRLSAFDVKAGTVDEPVRFPLSPIADFLKSVYEAPEIVERTINALMPKLQTWWWSKQAWYKKIFEDKDRAMKEQVSIGVKNVQAGRIETGVEHMLMREASRAAKEGREPDFNSAIFRDELFGDIVGGHHTTSGGMMWLAKYLSDLPLVQVKLRSTLYDALAVAKSENRFFTFEEIRQARLPYLDAVVEEMLRINAVPVTREALCDTTVLGYPIKKGTQIFFMSNGPGFLSPSLAVDDGRRSETSRSAKLNAKWDESQNLAVFEPERWLIRKKAGTGVSPDEVDFNGAAGPQLVFGLGQRSCWGRRLANMEMRIITAMLVWKFELQKAPESLSTYAGIEGIARVPQQCYLRVKKVEY
ncbi:cytochrome p450 monooxygenase [Grosmannia clavigera kw1407]|uniref:Cytochrome p450 monooxygenase n=1 Tax=Grosmannia clavigera (strain kw1407 / UAMH 11150) TaxID=655863 RepID=F0XI81_GROCL|nr:cytochrome p450 monooxygenase [Grosmannia clavigera kw1407]EFX02943.1 cytochrome p450 monooxygenase [Grosmannia clavigera kw1407]